MRTNSRQRKMVGPIAEVRAALQSIADGGDPPPSMKELRALLPHLNKNHVAGAVYRLRQKDFPHCPPVDQNRLEKAATAAQAREQEKAAATQARETLEQDRISARQKRVATEKPGVMVRLGRHDCQYISGAPSINDGCKCGGETQLGSPYCPTHHAACHRAAEPAANRMEASA